VLIFDPGFPAAGDLPECVTVVQGRELTLGHRHLHVVEQVF
jgi:hypothetical protein